MEDDNQDNNPPFVEDDQMERSSSTKRNDNQLFDDYYPDSTPFRLSSFDSSFDDRDRGIVQGIVNHVSSTPARPPARPPARLPASPPASPPRLRPRKRSVLKMKLEKVESERKVKEELDEDGAGRRSKPGYSGSRTRRPHKVDKYNKENYQRETGERRRKLQKINDYPPRRVKTQPAFEGKHSKFKKGMSRIPATDWFVVRDYEKNQTFYYNDETKCAQWHNPYQPDEQKKQKTLTQLKGSKWFKVFDPSSPNPYYYFNFDTKQSHWDCPKEFQFENDDAAHQLMRAHYGYTPDASLLDMASLASIGSVSSFVSDFSGSSIKHTPIGPPFLPQINGKKMTMAPAVDPNFVRLQNAVANFHPDSSGPLPPSFMVDNAFNGLPPQFRYFYEMCRMGAALRASTTTNSCLKQNPTAIPPEPQAPISDSIFAKKPGQQKQPEIDRGGAEE